MSVILLPNKFRQQPQYPARIDYAGLGKGIQLLFNPALGSVDLSTGRVWTPDGDVSIAAGRRGKVFNFPGFNGNYSYTGYSEITGNVGTFFMWCPTIGPADNFGHVFLHGRVSVLNWFQITDARKVLAFGQESSTAIPSWFNTTNRSFVASSGGTAAKIKAYIDGVDSGIAWTVAPTSWDAGNKVFEIGRYDAGSNWDFSGSILVLGYTTAVWGEAEARAFHQNPWLLFKAPSRRIWLASSGVTPHDLLGVGQIGSAETFGTPVLSAGIASSSVASSEALGSAEVMAGISAVGIATAEVIGSTAVAAVVSAAGDIETTEAGGSPKLAAGIASSAIASTESLGSAVLAAAIQAAGIASIEAIGAPEVGGVAPASVIGVGAIASAEVSGSPAVSATVEGSGVSSAESLGQPAVGIPAAFVAGAGQITTGEAFGFPAAALAVAVAGIDSAETAGNAGVVVAIDGAGNIATAEVVGVPLAGEASPQEISGAGGIASTEALGSPNIHPLVPYTGTGFQQGSGHRPIRRQHRQPVLVTVPHSIGTVGIESAERLGYPALIWRGRTRRIREEEFLLGRAA